jgi:hypothetical protein
VLIKEIERATNRVLLRRIITGLENAAELGVTDPQGFINIDTIPPLTLIDLHFTGTPNSGTFESVLKRARARLDKLPK